MTAPSSTVTMRVVRARDLQQQLDVERLGPAHVDHRGIERLGRLQRRIEQGAEGQDRDALAFAAHLALAERQRVERELAA